MTTIHLIAPSYILASPCGDCNPDSATTYDPDHVTCKECKEYADKEL